MVEKLVYVPPVGCVVAGEGILSARLCLRSVKGRTNVGGRKVHLRLAKMIGESVVPPGRNLILG